MCIAVSGRQARAYIYEHRAQRVNLLQSVGVQGFQGGPETSILKYEFFPSLPPSQHLCHYHVLNLHCCHPVHAYNPPTNNIAIFPTWSSSLNSSNHISEPSMSPIIFNSFFLSHSNSSHGTRKCSTSSILPPYHIAHIYPLHRAHISSCQQTSLLCLTSSWTSTWLPPDLVMTQCNFPTQN